MRDKPERRGSSALTWLISALVAVFVVQNVVRIPGVGLGLEDGLALSPGALRAGHVWTLLTYGFLHSTANLLQVIAYVLALYLTGREVLPVTGARRFLGLFGASLVAGGLAWCGLHWHQTGELVGASAAVCALIVVYACFYPNREISFVVFFVFPVTIRPKYLALTLLAVDLCGVVFYEVMHLPFPFYAAHSAHLGGMAAGWIYYRYIHDSRWSFASRRGDIELPRWVNQREAVSKGRAAPAYTVNLGDRAHLRAEVDRILDKINSEGFAALSDAEKRLLDEAKDLIGRQ